MKIKTITCHNVYNTGASLQAYALSRYLHNLGHDVEIIDYVPDYLVHHRLWGVSNPAYDKPVVRELYNLAKLPGRLCARYGPRKRAFDRFTDQYLPLTDRHYASYEELVADPPVADVYFAGSDQIWNSFFMNGRDPAFYLQFAPHDRIRASYAASFAVSEIAPEYREQTKKWLSDLDYISVRESSGLGILEQLDITGGVGVMDPVFLLSAEQWSELCPSQEIEDPYVLVYDFDGNPQIRQAAESLAATRGLKIYTLQKLGYGNKCVANAGPIEFVQLIRGASCVLSNSFHATAFSIIFHKQFWVFNRGEKINSRMNDLLEEVGLCSHMVNERDRVDVNTVIDYTSANSLLPQLIGQSKSYLQRILEKVHR